MMHPSDYKKQVGEHLILRYRMEGFKPEFYTREATRREIYFYALKARNLYGLDLDSVPAIMTAAVYMLGAEEIVATVDAERAKYRNPYGTMADAGKAAERTASEPGGAILEPAEPGFFGRMMLWLFGPRPVIDGDYVTRKQILERIQRIDQEAAKEEDWNDEENDDV